MLKTSSVSSALAIGSWLVAAQLYAAPNVAPQATGATVTPFFTFTGSNGAQPRSGVIKGSDGALYGTTYTGGTSNLGTVFKITSSGALTTLVSFTGSNGANPISGLLLAKDGNFYGTTYKGGANGLGTVYKMTPSGTLTTMVTFNTTNGANPYANLIQATDGNLYGATNFGGTGGPCSPGCGSIFKMSLSGDLTTLWSFKSTDGLYPQSGLTQGSDGNFYGTTLMGGANNWGTIYQLTPAGQLTTLVSFTGYNGAYPTYELVEGADGNFYGTTSAGAVQNYVCAYGCGNVFKVSPSGVFTQLAAFDLTNGAYPEGPLLLAADGNFYGMTLIGGSFTGTDCYHPHSREYGCGTVYQISPSGAFTTLTNLTSADGSYAMGKLYQDSSGAIYETMFAGGSGGQGGLVKITLTGN